MMVDYKKRGKKPTFTWYEEHIDTRIEIVIEGQSAVIQNTIATA